MTMPIPDGSAITTPREMLTEIQQLHGEFRELRGALTPTLDELRHNQIGDRKDIDDLFARTSKQDRRLTKIETRLVAAWTVLVLLIAVAGAVGGFLGHGA